MSWYRSKVDWWLLPLLGVAPVASLFAIANGIASGDQSTLITGIIAVLITAGVYFGLIFPMQYGIGEEMLVVRFGLCRQSIALKEIREVRRTNNPLSSPALSLDRLWIQYGDDLWGAVMISPADQEGFLKELGEKAGMVYKAEGLVKDRPSQSSE